VSAIKEFLDNWQTFIIAICLAFVCFEFIIKTVDYFCDRFGIETKSSLKKKKQEESLQKLQEKVECIDVLKKDIENLNNKLDVLTESFSSMKESNDFDKRATLKDRISQSYRYYHERKKWNHMEKEAFDDLIKSYENAGGKNSFVHTTCEPESCTWELID
jgi:hypothetical protein